MEEGDGDFALEVRGCLAGWIAIRGKKGIRLFSRSLMLDSVN